MRMASADSGTDLLNPLCSISTDEQRCISCQVKDAAKRLASLKKLGFASVPALLGNESQRGWTRRPRLKELHRRVISVKREDRGPCGLTVPLTLLGFRPLVVRRACRVAKHKICNKYAAEVSVMSRSSRMVDPIDAPYRNERCMSGSRSGWGPSSSAVAGRSHLAGPNF